MRTHKKSEHNKSRKPSSLSSAKSDGPSRGHSAKSEMPSRGHDSGSISNKCKLCGKNFSSRNGLKLHLPRDHGEDGEREMEKLSKITMSAISDSATTSSSYTSGYGMSYGSSSSSSTKRKSGSKLLGDSRRMIGEDGQEFEVEKNSQIRIM